MKQTSEESNFKKLYISVSVPLFNGISTFVAYLMPSSSL